MSRSPLPPALAPLVWLPGVGQVAVASSVLRGQTVGVLVESPGCFPFVAAAFWPYAPEPEECLYLVEAPAPVEFFHEASILKLFHVRPRSFFFYSRTRFEFAL